jgi:hypothetical protein
LTTSPSGGTSSGYSGTPLAKKLGFAARQTIALIGEPEHFRDLVEPVPEDITYRASLRGKPDIAIGFFTSKTAFRRRLPAMGRAIFPDGAIWIAWPKRASGMPTDMTEDIVRELALPTGLVDNKVCAIDDTWSGLRLVHRVERRSNLSARARNG